MLCGRSARLVFPEQRCQGESALKACLLVPMKHTNGNKEFGDVQLALLTLEVVSNNEPKPYRRCEGDAEAKSRFQP